MKKIILILIVLTAVLEGCKKYEEGPWLSFRSAKSRFQGNFTLIKYTVNGVDSLSLFNDSLYNTLYFFHDDNSNTNGYSIDGYRSDGRHIRLEAQWDLIDNNTKIVVTYSECYSIHTNDPWPSGTGPFVHHASPEWIILRLTNRELKMKTIYNNKEYLVDLK